MYFKKHLQLATLLTIAFVAIFISILTYALNKPSSAAVAGFVWTERDLGVGGIVAKTDASGKDWILGSKASGSDIAVFLSQNEGVTFNSVYDPNEIGVSTFDYTLYFENGTTPVILVARNGGQILKSINLGQNWTIHQNVSSWNLIEASKDGRLIVTTTLPNIYFGTLGQLFYSEDYGVSWQSIGPNGSYSSVTISEDGKSFIVGRIKTSSVPATTYLFSKSGSSWTFKEITLPANTNMKWDSFVTSGEETIVTSGNTIYVGHKDNTGNYQFEKKIDSFVPNSTQADIEKGVVITNSVNSTGPSDVYISTSGGNEWDKDDYLSTRKIQGFAVSKKAVYAIGFGLSGSSLKLYSSSIPAKQFELIAPKENQEITSRWAPQVSWGETNSNSQCLYRFDTASFSLVSCTLYGGDIPAPSSGTHTLEVKVITNGVPQSDTAIFNYQPITWSSFIPFLGLSKIDTSHDGSYLIGVNSFNIEGSPSRGGLYLSKNKGITWTPLVNFIGYGGNLAIYNANISSDGKKIVFVGDIGEGGAYVYVGDKAPSSDTYTWTKGKKSGQTLSGNFAGMDFSKDGIYGILGGYNGANSYIYVSSDGGYNWVEKRFLPNEAIHSAIAKTSENGQHMVFVTNDGVIRKSNAYGENLQVISSLTGTVTYLSISDDGSRIVAGLNNKKFYEYRNGTWTQLSWPSFTSIGVDIEEGSVFGLYDEGDNRTTQFSTNFGSSFEFHNRLIGLGGREAVFSGDNKTVFIRGYTGTGTQRAGALVVGQFDSTVITPDTTPPVATFRSPTSQLPAGTTSALMTVDTNEPATCKYSRTQGTNYDSMTLFDSTGKSLVHTRTASPLSNGQTYNYYIICRDAANNDSSVLFVSLSVANTQTVGPSASKVSESFTRVQAPKDLVQTAKYNLTIKVAAGSENITILPGSLVHSLADENGSKVVRGNIHNLTNLPSLITIVSGATKDSEGIKIQKDTDAVLAIDLSYQVKSVPQNYRALIESIQYKVGGVTKTFAFDSSFKTAPIYYGTLPKPVFSIAGTSQSLNLPMSLSSTHPGVSGYFVRESTTQYPYPQATDSGWVLNAPTNFTFAAEGQRHIWAWTKDSQGNISSHIGYGVIIDSTPASDEETLGAAGGNWMANIWEGFAGLFGF